MNWLDLEASKQQPTQMTTECKQQFAPHWALGKAAHLASIMSSTMPAGSPAASTTASHVWLVFDVCVSCVVPLKASECGVIITNSCAVKLNNEQARLG